MKNNILISALALGVMVISSCANEGIINEMSIGGNTVSFTAGTQSGLSKTVMTDDCKIIFAGGESIAIVSDNGTLFSASNSSSTSSALAVFNAQVDKSVIDASASFVAMYPDGVYNDGYQMELPAIQTATPNSFDPKANLLVANTTRDRMHFYFKNVCSYIEVDLPLETEEVTVWSKSPLAGTIKVDAEGNITDTLNASNTVTLRGDLKPGKYCIAVLPGYKDSLVVNPTNGHLSNVSTEYYYMSRGGIYSADFEEKAFEPSPEHPEVQLLSPADIVPYVNASDEEIVTLNMPLETYDHTEVMVEITKITDKKVKLIIPEGVKELAIVGEFLLTNPKSLVSVDLPKGVTKIGYGAFHKCSSLTSIAIPDGVTEIGDFAFSYSSLNSITIPEGVTTIPGGLFMECEKLTNVSLPESVTSIESSAFSWCTNLASINIPDGVTRIETAAFNFCTSLTSLTIPKGVTALGEDLFSGCRSLASVTIPESFTEIPRGFFMECKKLTSIAIPDGVTEIGEFAFSGSGLNSITIPEGVTTIPRGLFMECKNLTSITIPESVTEIEEWAFYNCDNLETIYCSQAIYDHYGYSQMVVVGGDSDENKGDDEVVDNSYTQITFQKQYGAMNFTPEDDYSIVIFEFEEQPYEVQVTITSDLFEKEESWGDAYYAAYFPSQYYLNGNTIRLNLNDVFYDNFAGLVNDRGETASKISTVAIQSTADGKNVVYLKSVTFVKNDGSTVVLKNSEDGFDFEMEVIK